MSGWSPTPFPDDYDPSAMIRRPAAVTVTSVSRPRRRPTWLAAAGVTAVAVGAVVLVIRPADPAVSAPSPDMAVPSVSKKATATVITSKVRITTLTASSASLPFTTHTPSTEAPATSSTPAPDPVPAEIPAPTELVAPQQPASEPAPAALLTFDVSVDCSSSSGSLSVSVTVQVGGGADPAAAAAAGGSASVRIDGYSAGGPIGQSLGKGRNVTLPVPAGAAAVWATASLGNLTASSSNLPCEVEVP